jgi:hypothetical protein
MAEVPEIGGREPIIIDLAAGGRKVPGGAESQSFCDSAHEARALSRGMEGDAEPPDSVSTCKRAKSPPFCDDSHEDR